MNMCINMYEYTCCTHVHRRCADIWHMGGLTLAHSPARRQSVCTRCAAHFNKSKDSRRPSMLLVRCGVQLLCHQFMNAALQRNECIGAWRYQDAMRRAKHQLQALRWNLSNASAIPVDTLAKSSFRVVCQYRHVSAPGTHQL